MRVLGVRNGFTYIFRCPDCGSKLEAERKDLVMFDITIDSSRRKVKFTCPICDHEKTIDYYDMTVEYKKRH